MRKELEEYYRMILKDESTEDKEGALAWRMSCYDSGQDMVNYVESHYFPLKDKMVLDSACAWGSHILACGKAGANVTGSDLNDHCYDRLRVFAKQQNIDLKIEQANCEKLPFEDSSFDLILGLELVEHIDSPQKYASEISRLLRDGGICIVTTPSRWKSVYWGEPHYNIKGLTLLPFSTQRFVATRIFGKNYPFPITRQYNTAAAVMQPFLEAGLTGAPKIKGLIAEKTRNIHLLHNIAKELLWDFIVFEKS